MIEEKCVICGDIVPEGRQVCPKCASDKNEYKEIKRLKNKAKFYYNLAKSYMCDVIYDEELEEEYKYD